MIVQLLGILLIAWIIVTVCIGVWGIYKTSKEFRAEEAYDRFLEGHQALIEYVETLPIEHFENYDEIREELMRVSADVLRYAECGEKSLRLASTLVGMELEELSEELTDEEFWEIVNRDGGDA